MFELHPQLAEDTVEIADLELCKLLLMNDSQYPWCILVPRVDGVREIHELSKPDQNQLLQESSHLGQVMMELFQGEKLNIGALGNLVPQLHIHHIVRFQSDPVWPGPVWGKLSPVPYKQHDAARMIQLLNASLN